MNETEKIPDKPIPIPVLGNTIPQELQTFPHWVIWKYEWQDGRWKKPPYVAGSPHKEAKSNDPSTWRPFDITIMYYESHTDVFDGIGFMTADNTPTGVDLDHCVTDGVINEFAQSIIERLNSYTEFSPSGHGVRIFVWGEIPGIVKTKEIELYPRGQYVTVTGQHIPDTPLTINDQQEELMRLYREYRPEQQVKLLPQNGHTSTLEDQEIINIASNAANKEKFLAFYKGVAGSRGQSEADQALVSMLFFYTQDEDQIDRIFRTSALCRKKWIDRPDYRQRTIKYARERTKKVYTPHDDWLDMFKVEEVIEAEEVINPGPQGCGEETVEESPINPDYRNDPWYSYLWMDEHSHISDDDRKKRIAKIAEIRALIPATGLIPEYIKTYLPTSDTPVSFLLASALTMAGHLLNRKVSMVTGTDTLYCNLWALVIANSSSLHKSSAINCVKRALKKDGDYSRTFISDNFTGQALKLQLGSLIPPTEVKSDDEFANLLGTDGVGSNWAIQNLRLNNETKWKQHQADGTEYLHGVGLQHLNEIGGWLQNLSGQNNLGIKAFITELFDSPDEYVDETKTQGTYYIWRPCLSIMGASTLEWLSENIKQSDLLGGFLPRWLIFPEKEKDYILPLRDEPNPDQEEKLLYEIEEVKKKRAERIRLSHDAKDYLRQWRRDLEQQAQDGEEAWANRMGTTCQKVAMIFEATTCGHLEQISLGSIQLACGLMSWLMKRLGRFLTEDLAFGTQDKNKKRVLEYIKKHKRVQHRTLMKHASSTWEMMKKDLVPILETLAESGCITTEEVKSTSKSAVFYMFVPQG